MTDSGDPTAYDDVVAANIRLHTSMSDQYSSCEPHFRPENVERVRQKLLRALGGVEPKRMLDLGCGTGFMIEIAKPLVPEIHGVDATRAMLDRVDTSGPAAITLHEGDTGSFEPEPGGFDLVTAYSFLHHLYDIRPTLATAATALRPGGVFYADLEPNEAFWHAIEDLERAGGEYDAIVEREIRAVRHRDHEIEEEFGVSADDFSRAEWGKTISGGFSAETLSTALTDAGFSSVSVFYEWFIGQGALINDESLTPDERVAHADAIDDLLRRALPLSKQLYKYLGFVAVR